MWGFVASASDVDHSLITFGQVKEKRFNYSGNRASNSSSFKRIFGGIIIVAHGEPKYLSGN